MRFFLPFLILLGISEPSWALSYGTPEGVCMMNLRVMFEVYRKEHGKLPDSFRELDPYFAKPVDEVFYYIEPSQRYVFLAGQNVHLRNEKIILIARSPFRNVTLSTSLWGGHRHGWTSPGRFFIGEDADGNLVSFFVAEEEVQKAFIGAGVPLPTQDPLGPRPSDVAYSGNVIWNRVLIGVLLLACLILVILGVRRRKKISVPVAS